MLKNRIAAVQMVSESLAASERAIDDALIASAELTLTVPKAQRHANLSPVVTQEAFALAGEAAAALQEARAKIVAAHNAFAKVRDKMGLRTRAGGSLWKFSAQAEADNEDRVAA